jgi:tRNA (cmo5U34)-methyltransferase
MENIFLQQPEFIDHDVRTQRPSTFFGNYQITTEFQYQRHRILLPHDMVQGCSVLDLGSATGATGAWVMSAGAAHYTGVELQDQFCAMSRECLSRYYPGQNWQVLQTDFESFFESEPAPYDIVLSFGSIYNSTGVEQHVKWLANASRRYIVVDVTIPPMQKRMLENAPKNTEQYKWAHNMAFTQYSNGLMVSDNGYSLGITSGWPTLGALELLLDPYGFRLLHNKSDALQALFPQCEGRYYAIFEKTDSPAQSLPDTREAVCNPDRSVVIPFDAADYRYLSYSDKSWKFDSKVADVFDIHARQHIPDYDRVIKKCVSLCTKYVPDPVQSCVLEVGCAVGETLQQLTSAGFSNLVGVESSLEMLEKSRARSRAQLIHSEQFPAELGPYHAVLCNWTLHFIREKQSYLQDIYNGLVPGGFLIVTDKTCNSGIDLDLYHDFKRSQGVSEQEIAAKAAAVQDIMFINDPEWYQTTLTDLGFQDVVIINQVPCFTTFLAFKPQDLLQ